MTALEKKLADHAQLIADTVTHALDGLTTFEEMLTRVEELAKKGREMLKTEASDNDN